MNLNASIPPRETQKEIYKDLENEKELVVGEAEYIISAKWLHEFKNSVSKCGPINNKPLFRGNKLSLDGKREKFDYEIISKDMWELLYSWYQGGPSIELQVINSDTGPKVLLSSLKLQCYYMNEEPKEIITNKYVKIEDLRRNIMNMFSIPLDKETRLWDYWLKDFKNCMKDENELIKYNLRENQEIRIHLLYKWFTILELLLLF